MVIVLISSESTSPKAKKSMLSEDSKQESGPMELVSRDLVPRLLLIILSSWITKILTQMMLVETMILEHHFMMKQVLELSIILIIIPYLT